MVKTTIKLSNSKKNWVVKYWHEDGAFLHSAIFPAIEGKPTVEQIRDRDIESRKFAIDINTLCRAGAFDEIETD